MVTTLAPNDPYDIEFKYAKSQDVHRLVEALDSSPLTTLKPVEFDNETSLETSLNRFAIGTSSPVAKPKVASTKIKRMSFYTGKPIELTSPELKQKKRIKIENGRQSPFSSVSLTRDLVNKHEKSVMEDEDTKFLHMTAEPGSSSQIRYVSMVIARLYWRFRVKR